MAFKDKKHVKKMNFKAGETWAEAMNVWHYGENLSTKDVEFIVTFAGAKGTPPTLSLTEK